MLKLNDSVQKEKHKGTFFNELEMFVILEQMMVSAKYSDLNEGKWDRTSFDKMQTIIYFFYEW